ncbi:hypothetical protein WCLP8_2030012 [uncultured Gammaproteobacteria bacterium]
MIFQHRLTQAVTIARRTRAVIAGTVALDAEDVAAGPLGIEKGILLGKAEGEAKGKAEGKADTLLRLLCRRFKTVPPDVESCVRAADIDHLDAWSERFADGLSLTEIFGLDLPH